MLIAYYSWTGNVKRFIGKLEGFTCLDITEHPHINEKFVLITNTIGLGEVPDKVSEFLKLNGERMTAVIASGNRVWGERQFGRSANIISKEYKVPILMKFENSGFPRDIELFKERVMELDVKMDRAK